MRSNEFHGNYTKHYYNGSERICSRLGDRTFSLSGNVAFSPQTQQRLATRIMQVDQNFRAELLELVEAGDVPVEFPNVLNLITLLPAGSNANSHSHSNPNTDIFYYHTNHLGSTAYVTDQNQTVTQGFLYAPFGEITTEYNSTFGNDIIPKYSFNAKELDEETGMYYYEARYYKPPVFTSRDAMFEKNITLSPYAYCTNNPIKYIDPNGLDTFVFDKYGKYSYSIKADGNHVGRYIQPSGKPYDFTFADPINDPISIQNGTITDLCVVQENDILNMLSKAGAFNEENKVSNSRYSYIKQEAMGGGKFDFSYTGIPHQYPKASPDPLKKPSSMLFLVDGVAHNQMNFGNFLYGAAGKALGLTLLELKMGAQWNSLAHPSTNGYGRQFDSADDQFSIRMGVQHANQHGYKSVVIPQKKQTKKR